MISPARLLSGSVVALALFAAVGVPGDAAARDPVAAGASLAETHWCYRCHGEKGVSENPRFPNLAGQKKGYLANQLNYFRAAPDQDATKTEASPVPRAHRSMAFNAKRLSKRDVNDLAAFYSAQACVSPEGEPPSPPAAAEICSTCHGWNGKGIADHVPILAGQNAVYLKTQLKLFRETADIPDQDIHKDWRYHRAMSVVSKVISEYDAEVLADYFSRLPCD